LAGANALELNPELELNPKLRQARRRVLSWLKVSLDLSPADDAGLSGPAGCIFKCSPWLATRAVASAGGGSTGPGLLLPWSQ